MSGTGVRYAATTRPMKVLLRNVRRVQGVYWYSLTTARRFRYAMPGTDIADHRYAVYHTGGGYAAMQCSASGLRICYAVSRTDLGYADTSNSTDPVR
eukprot:3604764-Rhodomonas_salina.4